MPRAAPATVVAGVHSVCVILGLLERGQPRAGRPFVLTDPNPPIQYGDLCFLIKTLAITRFHVIPVPPVVMVLLSCVVEAYALLRLKWWNHIHRTAKNVRFQSSVSLADEIQKATSTSNNTEDVTHEERRYVMMN